MSTTLDEYMKAVAWLFSEDTGASSEYMAAVMFGINECQYGHPYDSADFGRCLRFIDAVPGTREKLDMMRDKSPVWDAIIQAWGELEELYRYDKKAMVSDRLAQLIEAND